MRGPHKTCNFLLWVPTRGDATLYNKYAVERPVSYEQFRERYPIVP